MPLQKQLHVSVSNQLPKPYELGGSISGRDIQLKRLIPWFTAEIAILNHISSPLQQSTKVEVSLDKMYVSEMATVFVTDLAVNAKFYRKGKSTQSEYYQQSCQNSITTSVMKFLLVDVLIHPFARLYARYRLIDADSELSIFYIFNKNSRVNS